MKLTLLIVSFIACSLLTRAQLVMQADEFSIPNTPVLTQEAALLNTNPRQQEQKLKLQPQKWRMTGNRWLTGGLVFMAGASKGFNETLQFHWKAFRHSFPDVNPKWFNPAVSWKNKYKNGDPDAGARFPLSTSVLVMFTDQYHLNTFINRAAWTSAIIIKVGEGKKPLKHYLFDMLYYTACHQAGFALTYYPFNNYKGD